MKWLSNRPGKRKILWLLGEKYPGRQILALCYLEVGAAAACSGLYPWMYRHGAVGWQLCRMHTAGFARFELPSSLSLSLGGGGRPVDWICRSSNSEVLASWRMHDALSASDGEVLRMATGNRPLAIDQLMTVSCCQNLNSSLSLNSNVVSSSRQVP
jgi:hypothetical protein